MKRQQDNVLLIDNVTVYNESIFDFTTEKKYNLVFTCRVMIYLNPDMLKNVYEKMYAFSNKYILGKRIL